ncbi:hypothetical protein UFOVP1095_28 [uncultured Caudovirales phage]|uniref:Uncharacterized protein n=1 Tax=uncultured Caudovirales phage TaxID=2100421 RepID=A0A6J5PQ83_9CAUD|nr:hypothetical protein UFOVP918_28 [uncultured Caudovirales phage]CAB4182570.1 hypothetical protein UFOVP1095_28 [uncultured Caudovirales phage]CAB4214140.1 hypothetical protein UFOVP1452_28 [uncultured Caudovirales phage]CAB5228278.1 hypothetical protein UFOVP1540_5 [uncultured Caudovirales phage]
MHKIPNKTEQEINEKAFESMLKDYIDNSPRFKFGGMVNLLATIEGICHQRHNEREDDDYGIAEKALAECGAKCDLTYGDHI